jgi:hypothetical protein
MIAMMAELLKILWWLFFTIFKFIWTPFTLITTTDYLWWEAWLLTVGGGWIGVFIFFYFGKVVVNFFSKRSKGPRKRFSKLNRFIVKTKAKYGLTGLVAIIGIISVPVCSLIAAAYFDKKAVRALLLSVVIWGTSLIGIFYAGKSFLF